MHEQNRPSGGQQQQQQRERAGGPQRGTQPQRDPQQQAESEPTRGSKYQDEPRRSGWQESDSPAESAGRDEDDRFAGSSGVGLPVDADRPQGSRAGEDDLDDDSNRRDPSEDEQSGQHPERMRDEPDL